MSDARAVAVRLGGAVAGIARRWMTHPLARLAILGLVLRLALAPFTSWTGDMGFFYWTGLDLIGGRNPYHSMFYAYPPGWAYTFGLPLLGLTAFVPPGNLAAFVPSIVPLSQSTFLVVPVVTSPLFNLALKLPLIVADLITAWFVYQIVLVLKDAAAAKQAFALWFLNPLVILVGSMNGQFDVLPSLFLLLGLYFLMKREFPYAGIALSISVFYKLFAVYLLPAYLILLLRDRPGGPTRRWSEIPAVRFAAGFLAATGLLAAVFPWADGTYALLRRASVPTYGGLTPLAFLPLSAAPALGFPITVLSILAPLGLITVLGMYLARRSAPANPGDVVRTFAGLNVVALVIVFAFTPQVNPQYLLWILPSLILPAYTDRPRRGIVFALSGLGVAYLVYLVGPLGLLYPSAVWFGWPSVAAINASLLNLWGAVGFGGGSLQSQIILVFCLIGFLLLALEAVRTFAGLRRAGHA